MCAAAKNYYKDMEKVKNFSLYNSPVLDFIQKKQGTRTNPLIAVLCKESGYGRGLQMALKEISEQVMLFSSWENVSMLFLLISKEKSLRGIEKQEEM